MDSSSTEVASRASRLVGTFKDSFSPLAIRNFRIYLGGQAVSLVGTWLQLTAQGWVVWELSHSAASLGLVAMLGSLPILLLGPWAGVWADRLNRRILLIVTQAAAMMIAFVLAILIGTGQVQVWHLYITSVLLGIVAALDMPAQQAFLGDLSGMAEVRKAVLLNSMIFQTSRMIGPALAGLIIGTLGAAVAFWLNGFSFLAVIASLLLVRTNQVRASRLTNTWNGFREGMRFVGDHPRIQDLLLFAVLVTFLGLPIINIFPAVASQILNGDATTLGWLLAASGAGALVGVVFVLPITNSLQRTGLVIGSAVVWTGAWFMVFSLSTQLLTSMLSVFLVGLGVPSVMTAAMGLLQVSAPMDMRARLVSLFVIVTFGMQPLASLLVGYGAESLGITTVIRINSLLLMAIPVLMWMFRPHLRQWEVACEADHTAVCI